MSYQKLLRELAPDLNPAGVEASMRLHYGVLNHLPRDTFVAEALLAADLESGSPGILQKIADSLGMAEDFAKWEAAGTPLDPAQRHQIEQDEITAAWEAEHPVDCEGAVALLREIADLERDDDGDVIIGADEKGHNNLMARIATFLATHDR